MCGLRLAMRSAWEPALRARIVADRAPLRDTETVERTIMAMVEKALPEWEAEVVPEVRGAGENGARTWQRNGRGS
jgi:hypothetical protein